jgi:hypothetical protein
MRRGVVIGAKGTPTYLCPEDSSGRREVMKKLSFLAIALAMASAVGAHAQGEQGASRYLQLASYHRAHHGHSHGYGRMDDPSAEGRTSG